MSTQSATGDRRPKTKLAALALVAAALAGAAIVGVACGDDSSAVKEGNPNGDGGSSSGIMPTTDGAVVTPPADGGDSGPTDCVQNPQTHEEIINACTNATRIPKSPNLPLLLPDGGLPTIM